MERKVKGKVSAEMDTLRSMQKIKHLHDNSEKIIIRKERTMWLMLRPMTKKKKKATLMHAPPHTHTHWPLPVAAAE